MKKLALFLLFLSCTSYNYDIPMVTDNEQQARCASQSMCYMNDSNCCTTQCPGPQGPRGKRGKRGRRGRTGATGVAGTGGEGCFFINQYSIAQQQMTDGFVINFDPDSAFLAYPLTSPGVVVTAWHLPPFLLDLTILYLAPFVVPSDLDTTQPVFLDFHLFFAEEEFAPGTAALEVLAQYTGNGVEFGSNPPATGFVETVTSADFAVTPPADLENLVSAIVTVQLDGALMAGNDTGDLVIYRVAPTTGTQYNGSIYLDSIAVRYTRL